MLRQRGRWILLCAVMIIAVLGLAPIAGANTLDWKGITWNWTQVGSPVFVNPAGNLQVTGNMGVGTGQFGAKSVANQGVWITASFITPQWGTCPALFVDGLTESGTPSRFHIGLMGSNGDTYGARHMTQNYTTPYGATHVYKQRDPSDVGSEHHVGLHKPSHGNFVELWFDHEIMAIINTTDPAGGDILGNLGVISLSSFMPTNRSLPMEFTDFKIAVTPEPASLLLFGSGIGLLGWFRRRRRNRRDT